MPSSKQLTAAQTAGGKPGMVHLDLKLLRSFAAVAADCSVTRAARRLNLTQPTVSGQLKEMELALGFVLFHRTTRRIELTELGRRLLPFVQRVLDDVELLRGEIEDLQAVKASTFRLGAAMYTLDFEERANLVDAFLLDAPETRLVIDNRLQHAQVLDLLAGKLDAALLLGMSAHLAFSDRDLHLIEQGQIINEITYPDSLERVVLGKRRLGLLVPDTSPLARFEKIPPEALKGLEIAMLSDEHGAAFIQPIADFLQCAGASLILLAEGNALAVQRHAARHKMSALCIGWFPVPDGLVSRAVIGLDTQLELSLVLGTAPSKVARNFFEFARLRQGVADIHRT
jgi:DNA-binding transcriptional LysR family regulator